MRKVRGLAVGRRSGGGAVRCASSSSNWSDLTWGMEGAWVRLRVEPDREAARYGSPGCRLRRTTGPDPLRSKFLVAA